MKNFIKFLSVAVFVVLMINIFTAVIFAIIDWRGLKNLFYNISSNLIVIAYYFFATGFVFFASIIYTLLEKSGPYKVAAVSAVFVVVHAAFVGIIFGSRDSLLSVSSGFLWVCAAIGLLVNLITIYSLRRKT
jgi:hypothetical protein